MYIMMCVMSYRRLELYRQNYESLGNHEGSYVKVRYVYILYTYLAGSLLLLETLSMLLYCHFTDAVYICVGTLTYTCTYLYTLLSTYLSISMPICVHAGVR